MPYLLALLSALFYGAADFLGGLASRGASTIAVVVISQFSGLVLLGALLPILPAAAPARTDFGWGVAAGIFGSVGVALLYRALAIGTMSVVAPTTAVCAVLVPVAAHVALGDRPPPHTLAGIIVALLAIVLVSQQQDTAPADRGDRGPRALPGALGLALASGVAIGLFLLVLARTSSDAGLWPLVAARGVSLVAFGAVAVLRASLRLPRRTLIIALGGGILDMLANALYLVAVREGPLAPVVTLSSLYPASTVLLARVVLRERLTPAQMAGVAAALAAVALIVS